MLVSRKHAKIGVRLEMKKSHNSDSVCGDGCKYKFSSEHSNYK